VVIVRGNTRNYLDRHPGATDVVLVIEVADSTLERDRELKQSIYARAGIPQYWILNLSEQQLEIYTNPMSTTELASYQTRQDYRAKDEVAIVIEGREVGRVSVKQLLP
jgi:Uma2 family endonuclease